MRRQQLLLGSTCLFVPIRKYHVTTGTSVAQRQKHSDFALLKHSSPSLGKADTCALTERTSQYHGDRGTKRNRDKKPEDNRRESRDKAGDKDGGAAWCTLRRVGGWLCGGRVVLLWPPPFSSLAVAVCPPLVAKTPGCPRHRGATLEDNTKQSGEDLCVQCLSL